SGPRSAALFRSKNPALANTYPIFPRRIHSAAQHRTHPVWVRYLDRCHRRFRCRLQTARPIRLDRLHVAFAIRKVAPLAHLRSKVLPCSQESREFENYEAPTLVERSHIQHRASLTKQEIRASRRRAKMKLRAAKSNNANRSYH